MTQWQRIDGTLLAPDVAGQRDPLVDYFTRHSIPAVLEFPTATPWFVGLRLWVDEDGRVAAAGGGSLVSGLEVDELAEDIAERFGVDVMLGELVIEQEVDLHADDHEDHEGTAADAGPRVVTLLPAAGAPDVPGLARALEENLHVVDTQPGVAVLTEPGGAFPGLDGVGGDQLPLVQVIRDGEELSLHVQARGGDPVTFSWGAEKVVLPGGPDPEQQEFAARLASDDDVVAAILAAFPAASAADVGAALGASAADGPRELFSALGIDPAIAAFLDGDLAAGDVPGVRTVAPARPVEALRSSLGAAAEDVSELRLVELADEFQRRRPVVSRALSVSQTLAGVALLARAARRDTPWRAVALTTGVLLVVDGVGELVLYEWLRRRS